MVHHIRCIRVLVTKLSEEVSIASTRTNGRSEEAQLISGLISIGLEVSFLNSN